MGKIYKVLLLILCFSINLGYASEITVKINDKDVIFDVSPIIMNERTMVPMRAIFEDLGCEVEWLSQSQTVIATQNSKIIALQIGSNRIISTDVETNQTTVYESDVAPVIHNERTMIPVRVISEILGYKVDWESQTQEVIISR